MRSHSQTETAGMTDQGMQQRLGSTLARRLGLLTLVAAGCIAGTVVHAQMVEIYDDTWSDAAPLRPSQPLVVEGDRRATRPPTTVFIPDGASPPPAPQRVTPAAPSTGGQWAQVPPPEVDPTARWSRPTGHAAAVLPPPAPAQSSSDAGVRLAVPAPQVVGGPRARRSGASSMERSTSVPVAPSPRQAPVQPPWTQRPQASTGNVQADNAVTRLAPRTQSAERVMPEPDVSTGRGHVSASTLPTSFMPAGDQGLGPGDAVRVTVFGQPDLETQTVVGEDGSITLPLIDRVVVGGLSPQAAGNRIAAAYAEGEYLKNPQVNLTVEAIRSRQISVLGAVASPGRFPLESSTSVLDALAMAGGITAQGARTVTLVRRLGAVEQQRYNIRLDDLLSGSGAVGFNVAGGDTIYVPEAQKFYIYGEVRRPDAYPLHDPITVMQAISVGGGLTERGSESRVQLRRTDERGRTRTRSVELTEVVRPDDVIFVKERLF